MSKPKAIVLTNGLLDTMYAKTCHGLLRGTDRYQLVGIVDHVHAGKDTADVVLGDVEPILIDSSIEQALDRLDETPEWCVIGVAFEGGRLPDSFREELLFALNNGISVVNGLHTLLSEDPEMMSSATAGLARVFDIRKPKRLDHLHFWSGKIKEVTAPRVAVLGMDCAVGKRTTCSMLLTEARSRGLAAEMIYTGQTGWLQGYPYGCIVDSTLNDFVSGELEHAVWSCDRDRSPDLIFIEGQSSLRNPSGPFGAELLLSVQAKYVIVQHDPRRTYFDDDPEVGFEIPSVGSEIELYEKYGCEVVAVTLHPAMRSDFPGIADELSSDLGRLVVWVDEVGLSHIMDQVARATSQS